MEHTLVGHDRALAAVFSTTDRLVATGGMDRVVRLWSSASGKLRRELPAHAAVYGLAFSPDNALLAVGCADGVVRLWAMPFWSSRHNLEGDSAVTDLAWMPTGRLLACAHENGPVVLWSPDQRLRQAVWERPPTAGYGLAWSPQGRYLAGGYGARGAVAIWDVETSRLVRLLEGASGAVSGLSFSADGRLLAVTSTDGTTRLWQCETWEPVCVVPGERREYWLPGVAFHPQQPLLAIPAREDRVVEVFEVGAILEQHTSSEDAARYATAKVVLLGDTRAGKTSLAHRLASGEYREHRSTHGQQIWLLDGLQSRREDGTECEVLLWDLAGQRDYRILHTLFLSDADAILLVFDASELDDPLAGVRYWLHALERSGGRPRPMILVGAQCDEAASPLSPEDIEAFCRRHGIHGGYVPTSALKGHGLKDLLGRLQAMLLRAEITTTTTTAAFKRAREAVRALKARQVAGRPLLSLSELRQELGKVDPDLDLSDQDLAAALGDLVKHGHLQEILLNGRARGVLLEPELLYNAAASIVLRARTAHRGLGAVEEAAIFATGEMSTELPTMRAEERASILEAAVRTLLDHAVCVRESLGGKTLLVFPDLVYRRRPHPVSDTPTMEPLVSYTVEGAIENLFAVLAVRVGYADFVIGTTHWRNEVHYDVDGGTRLVLSAEKAEGRVLRLVLGRLGPDEAGFFNKLVGLVERLLLASDVALARFQVTACPHCEDRPSLVEVERNIRDGRGEMSCSACGSAIPLDLRTSVDSREREETTLSEDKENADRRFQFQPDLTSLKASVARRAAEPPRCILSGAVERRWAKRWMLDVSHAGIQIQADSDDAVPEHLRWCGTPGALWLRAKVPLDRSTSSGEKIHLVVPPGSDLPVEPLPHGSRLWDFRDPGRYFFVLLDILCVLHNLPWDERPLVRRRSRRQKSPLAPDHSASESLHTPHSVVCIHHPRDAKYAKALRRHVSQLKKQNKITFWTPDDVQAGQDRDEVITNKIADARVIVVLLSAYFLDCDIWDLVTRYQRSHGHELPLFPVMVRAVNLDGTEFAKRQRLPRDGQAIRALSDPDQAWHSVTTELRTKLGC
ncbi:GTP-binding protein [Sorangium sp. So ce1182]|uniref:GTP-binding protein n=1 Tax=Sorangium sp. So ce1182 TaxID=3133334 RepID=UPI003F5E8629